MIDLAKDLERNPAERYVRLRESQRLAAEHGHVVLAVEAIDTLAEHFDVDPLPHKQRCIVGAFQGSNAADQVQAARNHLVRLIAEAAQQDAFFSLVRSSPAPPVQRQSAHS